MTPTIAWRSDTLHPWAPGVATRSPGADVSSAGYTEASRERAGGKYAGAPEAPRGTGTLASGTPPFALSLA